MHTGVVSIATHNQGSSSPPDPQGAAAADDLLAYLLNTIHSARGSILVSAVLSFLINLSAYAMVGDRMFLAGELLASLVVNAGRLRQLDAWRAARRQPMSTQQLQSWDRKYLVWSALLSLLLGLVAYHLAAHGDRPGAFSLAVAMCTGFSISFATGSAGRPLTAAAQIAGVTGPMIFGFLTLDMPLGVYWAAMTVVLDFGALLVASFTRNRIIGLYRANEENRRLAQTDILTGLKNRHAMGRALERALAAPGGADGARLAVCVIDLDRFKQINDTLGMQVGDAVIVEIATRLREAARRLGEVDIARMGGDEFMALGRLGAADIEAMGPRLVELLGRPFLFNGATIPLSASVGVAVQEDEGGDAAGLMKRADHALREARREGRGRWRLYDADLAARVAADEALENALADALRLDQLEVWYQPLHDVRRGEVSGYEALVRWRHPRLGLIPPDRFVGLAEQNGAIHALGEIVLEKACREAATWTGGQTVAVNLSPKQFLRPLALVVAVRRALETSGLDPARLHLEITENFLMDDNEDTREAIRALEAMGPRFSLDDFGRGYSSLGYIQKYPFSKIKIDREFVRNVPGDAVSSAIVASVCLLGRRIGMTVVAEGVETKAQSEALSELGVDLLQGYLYGRPAAIPLHKAAFAERRATG